MSNWSVINVQKDTIVAIGGLQSAIQNARPGELIEVETAGAPTAITLAGVNIGGYGVTVRLPMDQVVSVEATNSSGVHFVGGDFSNDTVSGTIASASYGIDLTNCSKFSWTGSRFRNNSNSVNISDTVTDVEIRNCLIELSRADAIQAAGVQRFRVDNTTFGQSFRGEKFCYFNDGRAPVEGQNSSSCTAAGGTWEDTTHNDVAQLRRNSHDVTFTNNTSFSNAQGLVVFDQTTEQEISYRWRVWDNTFTNISQWGCFIRGSDLDLRRNSFTEEDGSASTLTVRKEGDLPQRVYGGQNVASAINSPSGVDLASATLNGDAGVVPPSLPNIIRAPWAPSASVPTASPDGVPTYAAGGGIRPVGNPALGAWLSINRGQWQGALGSTWEFRWTRNGTPISGSTAQVYQVQAGDIGQSLTCEVRGTNAQGTGEWYAFPAVSPA